MPVSNTKVATAFNTIKALSFHIKPTKVHIKHPTKLSIKSTSGNSCNDLKQIASIIKQLATHFKYQSVVLSFLIIVSIC